MAKVDILNYISDDNILRSTYDTDTNELDITDVPQNLNSIITLGGGGGSVTVEELNISANGTYTAPEGKAYSPVNVNVVDLEGIMSGTIPSGDIEITMLHDIPIYAFFGRENVTGLVINMNGYKFTAGDYHIGHNDNMTKLRINFPDDNTTSLPNYTVTTNALLDTIVITGKLGNIGQSFRNNVKLTKIDIPFSSSLGSNSLLGCTILDTVIIRSDTVVPLGATSAFNQTPFASGGAGGTLYVPDALIATYQGSTNWSTILGYANNQIKKIEGTIYETQYADGTPIGA